MTDTVVEFEPAGEPVAEPVPAASDEQLIAMLVDRARSEGLQLTGQGGSSNLSGAPSVHTD
jgi:hypothetical protein